MKDVTNKNQDAKVIQFPGVTAEKATIVAETKAANKMNMKKPMLALASTVLVATAVNFFLPKNSNSSSEIYAQNDRGVQSRSLASVGDSGRAMRDKGYEDLLAQKLSKMTSREIASVGRVPSFEDRLRFGYLEGKYALRMNDGKIREIEFASSPDSPKYLNDRIEFLKSYKGLMPVQFEQAKSVGREVMPQKIHETYQLVQNEKVGAEVKFELDLYGRLLSMKVESVKQ